MVPGLQELAAQELALRGIRSPQTDLGSPKSATCYVLGLRMGQEKPGPPPSRSLQDFTRHSPSFRKRQHM